MKRLFVILILISNTALAGTTNEILKNLPKKVVEMISEYPQALQLQMDCFVQSCASKEHDRSNIEDAVLCDAIISDIFEASI